MYKRRTCETLYILNKQTNKQANIFVYISWAMQEGRGGPPEAGGWWYSGVMKLHAATQCD